MKDDKVHENKARRKQGVLELLKITIMIPQACS